MTEARSTLVKVTDPRLIEEILQKQSPSQHYGRKIHCSDVSIVKQHLRKTIIQYTVQFDSTTKTIMGLHRESDNRLEYMFWVLQTLRSKGFDDSSDLRVPEPIAHLPSLSLLLMAKAEGRLLGKLVEEQDHNLDRYFEGAALWLAKLHNTHITFNKTRSISDEVETTRKYAQPLLQLFPQHAPKIRSLSGLVIQQLRSFRTNSPLPIHSDYHSKNIFSTLRGTTVIDVEHASMGDPAFDPGYFIAQLKMSYGFKPTILNAAQAFLDKYRRVSPHAEDFARRVCIYEAQTYLQRLYHTYWLLKLTPDFNLVSEWLMESEKCLDRTH